MKRKDWELIRDILLYINFGCFIITILLFIFRNSPFIGNITPFLVFWSIAMILYLITHVVITQKYTK